MGRDRQKSVKGTVEKLKKESIQVRATGDWSSYSKLAAIANGLWSDPLFEKFNGAGASSVPRRTSLICNGYFVRYRICDFFIRKLIESSVAPLQIVALGGGMDTLYFRLLPDCGSKMSKFFDVDFPSVIARKEEIIQKDPSLRDIVNDGNLFLVAGDLRCIEKLFSSLRTAGFESQAPTIFYSECVVNYLAPAESNNILSWINQNMPQSIFFAYEQANPNDSFGRVMVEHFRKNGCPILSVNPNGTLSLQYAQLRQNNFEFCYVINAWDAFIDISKEDTHPIPKIPALQFDEYEALVGTCLHYSVRIGITKNMTYSSLGFLAGFTNPNPTFSHVTHRTILRVDNDRVYCCKNNLKLSGHRSIVARDRIYFLGGSDQASKLQSCIQLMVCSFTDNLFSIQCENILEDELLGRNYAALDYSEISNTIYIHGGRKSPLRPRNSEIICISLDSLTLTQYNQTSRISAGDDLSKMPCERWRHCIASLYSQNSSSSFFLYGGKTAEKTLGDSWIFTSVTGSWERLDEDKTEHPSPRHSHSMCASIFRNSIFLTGGISDNDTSLCLDSFWEYKLDQKKWKRWHNFESIGRKVGHMVIEHGSHLYIVGGYGNVRDTTLETFISTIHLETLEVGIFELKLDVPHLFLPFDFSAHVVRPEGTDDEFLVAIGGGGNCFSFGSVYNTDCFFFKLPLQLS